MGVGTLYRHFPTKEKLCEAILLERLSALTVDARALADAAGPRRRVLRLSGRTSSRRGRPSGTSWSWSWVPALEFEVTSAEVKDGLRQAVGLLLERAQAAGAVRPDVTATMVVSLVGATCQAASHTVGAPACDLLAIVCDGLRPQVGA